MNWLLFALIGLIGQVIWGLLPKIFHSTNPFSTLFWFCVIGLILFPIASKLSSGYWYDVSDWKMGLGYVIAGGLGTAAILYAVQYGGKLSYILTIYQFALLITIVVSVARYQEKVTITQLGGILLMCLGGGIFFYFQK